MTDQPSRDRPRYEDDFYAWTQFQAEVLRALPVIDNRFDREHIAEEIEDLGKSERDAVESQIVRILEHFLKLAYSPTDRPRYGWMRSILDARLIIGQKMTATLRRRAQGALARLYQHAREAAELGLREYDGHDGADSLPAECPYTLAQVMEPGWYPSRANRPTRRRAPDNRPL